MLLYYHRARSSSLDPWEVMLQHAQGFRPHAMTLVAFEYILSINSGAIRLRAYGIIIYIRILWRVGRAGDGGRCRQSVGYSLPSIPRAL